MSHFSDQYITDCDSRTSDDDYLDRRDGVSSAPVLPTAKSEPTYTKTINPAYETIGSRKKLTGYLAELYDGNILLYSCEYDTNSQAEKVLDELIFDLLTDLHEHGLVDDMPAALEAENVSSTHLPSWQPAPSLYALVVAECQAELDAHMAEPVEYHTVSHSPFCAEPDNHCAVHDPCPAHAADAARYLAQQSLTTWQPASILVEDLPF